MSVQGDCGGCMAGDHTQHDTNWGITPGLIGGTYCGCPGDCEERAHQRSEAIGEFFRRAIEGLRDGTVAPPAPTVPADAAASSG